MFERRRVYQLTQEQMIALIDALESGDRDKRMVFARMLEAILRRSE